MIKGELVWSPATEQDINAATTGISSEDFYQVFRGDVDLTFEAIRSRFKANGYNYTDEEIAGVLDLLVENGKLNRVEIDGEIIYRTVKNAKKTAQTITRMEKVFGAIREAGDRGIITTELGAHRICGNDLLAECLEELTRLGRIYWRAEGSNGKRYFATGDHLTVI
jgi:hypothetical protein